jgi:hypothetical protein
MENGRNGVGKPIGAEKVNVVGKTMGPEKNQKESEQNEVGTNKLK